MIKKMDLVEWFIQMAHIIPDNGKMINVVCVYEIKPYFFLVFC